MSLPNRFILHLHYLIMIESLFYSKPVLLGQSPLIQLTEPSGEQAQTLTVSMCEGGEGRGRGNSFET